VTAGFDVFGDPVRRGLLELLATGERSSGEMTEIVQAEFGLTQSAVSAPRDCVHLIS